MAKSEAFCMDCLEAMRQMPDNAYDLAVVDPPYGDAGAGGGWNRFGERFDRYKTPADGSPAQLCPHPREREREKRESAAWAGTERQTAGRLMGCRELEASGRRSSEKNYRVGRSPRERILRRTFPRLTLPDHLGGELLRTTAESLFPDMGENEHPGGVHDGDV